MNKIITKTRSLSAPDVQAALTAELGFIKTEGAVPERLEQLTRLFAGFRGSFHATLQFIFKNRLAQAKAVAEREAEATLCKLRYASVKAAAPRKKGAEKEAKNASVVKLVERFLAGHSAFEYSREEYEEKAADTWTVSDRLLYSNGSEETARLYASCLLDDRYTWEIDGFQATVGQVLKVLLEQDEAVATAYLALLRERRRPLELPAPATGEEVIEASFEQAA